MIRARAVVDGNVQGVSYRALVKQVARRLGVKGLVRNLEERGVEIFCESSNESVLQNFVKMIDKKGDREEPFSLNVEKINIYREGKKGYVNPPVQFKTFDVDYKIKLDPFQKESIEKSEIGGLLLLDTRDEVKGSRKDIKGVRDEIREFRTETKESFNSLDEKYHVVSQSLKSSDETQKMMKEELSEMRK
ncbi:MAG: acylphosphatase, partial [Thermoplasmatales archaeon]|nr:acylphosphatase [Thermoplasmatales archaeon]